MKGSKLIVWAIALIAVLAIAFLVTRTGTPTSGDIDNAELRKLVADGARLIDVRTQQEYEMGHIPDAELVPIDEFPQTASGWDRSEPVVVYCATGSRSLSAAQWATANGFEEVYNLAAGIEGWDGELSTQPSQAPAKAEPSASGLPVMYDFSSDS